VTGRRVLVTGATGLVGSRSLAPLAALGFSVHVIGRNAPRSAVDGFHRADLRDRDSVRAALDAVRPSHLLHCAWYVAHGSFWAALENVDWIATTAALARDAAERGLTRFVGVGSCAEYDWSDEGAAPLGEDDALRPATLYGRSKAATFAILRDILEPAGVSLAWGRLFHLYGPGEPPERLMPSIVRSLVAGREALVGPGEAVRDFMHVADAGAALAALVASGADGAVNLASGESVTVSWVAHRLGELAGRPDLVRIGALPARPGDPTAMRARTDRLRNEVGFRPRQSLADGLADYVSGLKSVETPDERPARRSTQP
jgi:nucleoside-diphosphate-sugar epimerase